MVDILRAVIDALELQGLSENVAYEQLLDCMAEYNMAVITPAPALRPTKDLIPGCKGSETVYTAGSKIIICCQLPLAAERI